MIDGRSAALLFLLAWLIGCGGAKGGSAAPIAPVASAAPTASVAPSAEPVAPKSPPPDTGVLAEPEPAPADDALKKEAKVDPAPAPKPQKMAVAVPASTGKLSHDDILGAISDAESLFDVCHAMGAGAGKPFVATVTVKAAITGEGRVTEATLQRSTSKSSKIDKCVVDAVHKVTFPAAKDGAASVFTFPVELKGSASQAP